MRSLGVDIGGSKLLACLVDDAGRVLFRTRQATGRSLAPDDAVSRVTAVVAEARRNAGGCDAIGIGFPGLVDPQRGLARSSVMIDGWRDVALAARVEASTGLPCAIDNDVNAAARSEVARRGQADRDLLFVAVGTGIGGAVVINGAIWPGTSGLAGEVGHLCVDARGPRCECGARGCVNLYASGTAIAARLASAGLSWPAGEDGDHEAAWAVIDGGARALGRALGSALNLLNLPLVVIGGGVAELGDRYITEVARAANESCMAEIAASCRFELARAGYEAAAIGAALLGAHAARGRATTTGDPAPDREAG